MPAGLLALCTSLFWGTSDFLAGVASRRATAWGVALVCQAVAALGSVALLAVLAPATPAIGILVLLLLGGLSSTVGVFAQFRALTLTKMSVVSPIIAGAAIVPVLWGLARGEKPSALQSLGAGAALLGIAMLSRAEPDAPEDRVPVDHRAGALLAVIAALAIGLMLVALDYGASASRYWTVAVVRCSAAICIGVALATTRPKLRLQRAAIPMLIVVGLLILAGNVSFAAASALGSLSVVAVLSLLGPAVTILWARMLLGEHLRPAQWLAVVLVMMGACCLALG